MKFVLEQNYDNFELIGKKAQVLVKLEKIIDNIPKWFVISYEGFDIKNKKIKKEAEEEILQKLKGFSDNTYFAIRPSLIEDEYFENQYETFLAVKKENILEKITQIYIKALSEESENYRKENNIKNVQLPSIIVQKMINADKSGYAFGANPRTSNVKETLITAVYGLGIDLKIREEKSDSYIICNEDITKDIARKDIFYKIDNNEILKNEVEKKERKKQVLPKEEILQVKEIVEKASELFGRFQKIEWLVEKEKIYIINSKPITNLVSPQNKEIKTELMENNVTVRNYEGITTPLTFSFIRTAYENMYIQICKIFNVEKEKIEMNSQMFKNILALIDGRVYYNTNGWYEMLEVFPELGKNQIHMEKVIGVNELAPENLLPVIQESNFKEKFEVMKNRYDVFSKTRKVKKITDKFNSRMNDIINRKNIKNMNLEELHDYYYEIERKILAKWDAPIINEFLSAIFEKQLKEQCLKYFQDEAASLKDDLLCRENGIISIDVAQRIKEMAEIARCDRSLIRLLEKDDILYIKKNLIQYSKFYDAINEYLDIYSDRCIHELKLESKNLKEDPKPLYQAIAALARRMKDYEIDYTDYEYINKKAEEKVKPIFKYNLIGKAKFDYNLKHARETVQNKEELRYERTKIFGRIRELFLRIGLILTSMNILEDKRDVMYLETDEILDYIAGKSVTNNLKDLVEIRKKQYSQYQKDMINKKIEEDKTRKKKSKEILELKGKGTMEGWAKGKAKIITTIDNEKITEGEILVAKYNDPGWIMLYPKAEGVLLEKEKVTSEAVMVAKEIGVPIIVGIDGLLEKVSNGDRLEFNSKTGYIVKNIK